MIVSIGLTPGAVGSAEASPTQTPGTSCSSPQGPATEPPARSRAGTSPSGAPSTRCLLGRGLEPLPGRRRSPRPAPAGSSQWKVKISLAPRARCRRASSMCARARRAVDGAVEAPAHDRLAGRIEHDLAAAVVVRDRVPGRGAPQAQHPSLCAAPPANAIEEAKNGRLRLTDATKKPEPWTASAKAKDTLAWICPSHESHLLVVDARDEVGGVKPQEAADRGAADAGRRRSAGRLDTAGGDDDRRRLDRQLGLAGARVRRRPPPGRRGRARGRRRSRPRTGPGVGGVLEVGLERRRLQPCWQPALQ